MDQTVSANPAEAVERIIKCYCKVVEKGYGDKNQQVLCQRLLTDISEWCLRFPKYLWSEKGNILQSVAQVITVCLQDDRSWLFPEASACQKLLTQFWSQYPLPSPFRIAQLGSMETETESLLDSRVVAYGHDLIWSAGPEGDGGSRILVRSVAGKHCWSVQEETANSGHFQGSNPLDQWLRNCARNLSAVEEKRGKPVGDLSARDSSDLLGRLLRHLSKTSPEALPHPNFPLPSDEPTVPHESEISSCLHQLNLHSTAESEEWTREEVKERKLMELAEWRCLIGDLSFVTWNRNAALSTLGGDAERLQRELRHIDKIFARETHKLAVIYVAEGQEVNCKITCLTRPSVEDLGIVILIDVMLIPPLRSI